MLSRKTKNDIFIGLDVGTTKVVALVGAVDDRGSLEIIGIGSHASSGLKRGMVVNIDATVDSIKRAIEEAELMAGCKINSAYIGISGSHIRSLNSHGIVAIHGHEVEQSDIDRVIDAAKAVAIPADQKIIHILPQEFIVDSQEGIFEPIGMSGVRLESKVHIVTGSVTSVHNMTKCVEQCGIKVDDVILQQLASSYAVLNEDEKELGVCMIDIGGGTTDIAVFTNSAIRHTAVIPIAGNQVTNDISIALRTPKKNAEKIKIKYGCALSKLALDEAIEILGVHESNSLNRKVLADVIEARYTELFALVSSELRKSNFEDLITSGIVITGGASKVDGLLDLAKTVFKMPVRLGVPEQM